MKFLWWRANAYINSTMYFLHIGKEYFLHAHVHTHTEDMVLICYYTKSHISSLVITKQEKHFVQLPQNSHSLYKMTYSWKEFIAISGGRIVQLLNNPDITDKRKWHQIFHPFCTHSQSQCSFIIYLVQQSNQPNLS